MRRSKTSLYICILWLLTLAGCTEAEGQVQHTEERKIQAVTLDAVRPPEPGFMEGLQQMGVTHITLVSFGFQSGYDVPEVRMHTEANWYSESDKGIRAVAQEADSLGMQVILKPHIWVGNYHSGGQKRDAIGFDTEESWQQWEAQYRTFMLHYAHLAQEVNAAILVVGTELATVAHTRPAFWRDLIGQVRTVYNGKLTYAANWWEEYENVPFWDALDYIGIQAYFELSKADEPTLERLRAGWEPYKETMQRLVEQTDKPVLFTEIGYRNVPDAAAQPWRWPSRDEIDTVQPDDSLQVRLYQAFFESIWHEPWFSGAILWKWHPDTQRRRRYLGFSPQNKPAEQVIGEWFTSPNTSGVQR